MSTQLKSIEGKIEVSQNLETKYKDREVMLDVFYGGDKRGKSLQITFQNQFEEYCHIQLDNQNTKSLVKQLLEEFL